MQKHVLPTQREAKNNSNYSQKRAEAGRNIPVCNGRAVVIDCQYDNARTKAGLYIAQARVRLAREGGNEGGREGVSEAKRTRAEAGHGQVRDG